MNSPRPDPIIPDHEVLRKIGGGAYGEVWLARGVTGALRAVKVLWREDFEDERSFEREFEGILKFEPISRDHPGMVNILHVGRSPDGKAFYYYVMELGDDVIAGRDINPVEYEARTLRSDTKRSPNRPLDTSFCIDVGVRLAEALRHLHDNGLAHRDVKPANVIFVAGRAKLADIGLVAARGQRTFVGTEGFVPPEGPGSAQADVYSLGKVLYEIATGKDRMEFPELPDELPVGSERKRWLQLNQIICDICEPHLSKRRISSAGDLADALRRLQEGKRRRRRRPVGAFIAMLMVLGLAVYGGWDMIKEHFDKPQVPVVMVREGRIRITSDPAEANVFSESGELIGTTPTEPIVARVGEERVFTLKKDGFRDVELPVKVPASAAEETLLISQKMEVYSPPGFELEWTDQLGQRYRWLVDGHEAVAPVGEKEWLKFKEEKPAANGEIMEVPDGKGKRRIVLTTRGDARDFCWWLARTGREAGYLTDRHQVTVHMDESFDAPGISERAKKEGLKPFKPFVGVIPFGRLVITTQPDGATVTIRPKDDIERERTFSGEDTLGPLRVEEIKPGEVDVIVWMEGYKRIEKKITLKENELQELHFNLELFNQSVVMEKDWTNGLGMKFVPLSIPPAVGSVKKMELLASIWETRVKDFDAYLRANPAANQNARPTFFQGPNPEDHPVVNIKREEAQDFCRWLTEEERRQGRLTDLHRYRLPTDYEWSIMAGLIGEIPEVSPAKRDLGVPVFPWGTQFPPVFNGKNVGNFADQSAVAAPGVIPARTITDYNDGFVTTAPVGSFEPNAQRIYDLSGNVQEWVDDNYASNQNYGVLRGGSWKSYLPSTLYTGYRFTQQMPEPLIDGPKPDEPFDNTFGFRIVLAKESPPKQETPPTNSIDDNG
ncbi:SUMF1/EgtB/PvdO family nonheme iron enzyme [Haloferula sp. BvORR071]|uniref:protein kinase domain-containing protein n=1 Tax=Haloferula sp. BvORR071 TaxID=1396141 RepID=UPI00054D19B0|nr:SUMF1/EgtB/PvdO family nonheme iron enzyme [Haloferula sp. BvORR071]